MTPTGWILKRENPVEHYYQYYAGGTGREAWAPDIQQAFSFANRSEADQRLSALSKSDTKHRYSLLTGRPWPPSRNEALERLDETLTNLRLPLPERPSIEEIRWQEMTDWLGDPGLEVIVILGSDTSEEELHHSLLGPVRDAIHGLVQDLGLPDFPYIRFILRSELEVLKTLAGAFTATCTNSPRSWRGRTEVGPDRPTCAGRSPPHTVLSSSFS